MAQIDKIIAFMLKQGGTRVEVPSDHSCVMLTPTGERPLNRVLTLAEVRAMVEEVLPAGCEDKYAAGGTFTFDHEAGGTPVTVRVNKTDDDLTVAIGTSRAALDKQVEVPGPAAEPEREPEAQAPPKSAEGRPEPLPEPTPTPAPSPPAAAAPPVAQPAPAAVPAVLTPAEPDPKLVQIAEAAGAYSALDVVLMPGCPPLGRYVDTIRPLEQFEPLSAAEIEALLMPLVPAWDRSAPTATAVTLGDRYRGRFSLSLTRRNVGATIRLLRHPPPSIDDIDAPEVLERLCAPSEGLIIVSSRAGHGRSTTVAALVDSINRTRRKFIITMAPVLEYLHTPVRSFISEREVGGSSNAWGSWLEEIPAERPHVVTLDNIGLRLPLLSAIRLAQEGILVIGEAPAMSSTAAIEDAIRSMTAEYPAAAETFAEVFRGVVFQVLCPTADGPVRAAYEVILGSPAVVEAIRERNAEGIMSHARAGRSQGTILLNESLCQLVKDEAVAAADAILVSTDRKELRAMLEESGIEVPD